MPHLESYLTVWCQN